MPEKPASRESVGLGLAATLLLHLAVYGFFPWEWAVPQPKDDVESLIVELAKPVTTPEQPQPQQFVPTNPDVPQNIPDHTPNIAAQDQQASQIEPDKLGPVDESALQGEMEDAKNLVETREAVAMVLPRFVTPPSDARRPAEVAESRQMPPLPSAPDFIKQEPVSEDGLASVLKPGVAEAPKPDADPEQTLIVDAISQKLMETLAQVEASVMPAPESPESETETDPRPRPRIDPLVSGPLKKSLGGARQMNLVAANARFSEFGDYTQKVYDAVGLRWYDLVRNSQAVYDELGTMVHIKFSLDSSGHITQFKVERSSAGRVATHLCQDAVKSRAPFGQWTQDMVAALNEEEEFSIRFFYR